MCVGAISYDLAPPMRTRSSVNASKDFSWADQSGVAWRPDRFRRLRCQPKRAAANSSSPVARVLDRGRRVAGLSLRQLSILCAL